MKAIIKPKEVEYLQWNDNLSEMKRFCLDHCTITYETCPIDEFWSLQVYDWVKDTKVTVALLDYVVKLDAGMYTVVDRNDFNNWFDV